MARFLPPWTFGILGFVALLGVALPLSFLQGQTPQPSPTPGGTPPPACLATPTPYCGPALLPSISSVNPNSMQAGGAAFTLSVNGQYFSTQAAVYWNGSSLATTVLSSVLLQADVPAANIIVSTTAQITVVDAGYAPTGSAGPLPFYVTQTTATVTASTSATSTSPTGTARATLSSVNATAVGIGTVSVATYSADPGAPTSGFSAATAYIDVSVAPGSRFTTLTIVVCSLGGGTAVSWYNGTAWVPVSPQSYDPIRLCVTMVLDQTGSSPLISQLTGTIFAVGKPTPQDTTPPTLHLPANMTVNATSPSGAVVPYTATATDLVDGTDAVSCSPATGSTFAIGMTTVNCSTTDNHSNTATGSFTVTVLGASQQTSNLITTLKGMGLDAGTTSAVIASLQAALSSLSSGNITAACGQLNAFDQQVSAQSGKKLTASQADTLTQLADRIRAVNGCS